MSETSDSDDEIMASGQLYDVILMHSENEKDLADTVCKKIRGLSLGDDVFPVVDTFERMSLLGNQEVDDIDYAVEQSTFIMFFRTKEFFKDEMRSFAAGVALDNAIRSRNKSRRWSLIPIDIESKVKISRRATINSLSGFTITTNGDFDKDMTRVRNTLISKMHVRLEKEKRRAECNDRTLEKEVRESQTCQHPSVDDGGVNPVSARKTSHQDDLADMVSGMHNMELDVTSVKRPASESPTSDLYGPGPNCEETGDEVFGNVQLDRIFIPETGPGYFEVANPSMSPEESTGEIFSITAEIPRGDRFLHDDSRGDASMRTSSDNTAMSTYPASDFSNDTGLQPQYSAAADKDRLCADIAVVGLRRQAGGNLNSVILHSDQHRSQDSLHLTNTPGTLPFRQSSLSEFSLLVADTGTSHNSSDSASCLQKEHNMGGFVQSQETQNVVVDSVGGALYTGAVTTDVLPGEAGCTTFQQQQTIPHQQQQWQSSQQLQQQTRSQPPQYWQQRQLPQNQLRQQPRQQQLQHLHQQQQHQQLEWQHLQHQQQQAQTEHNNMEASYDFGFADLARGSQNHDLGSSVDSGLGSSIPGPSTAYGGIESKDNSSCLPRSARRNGSGETTSVPSQDVYPVVDDMLEGASDPGCASANLTNTLNRDPYYVSRGPFVSRGTSVSRGPFVSRGPSVSSDPPAVAREPPAASGATAARRGPPDGSELPVESVHFEVIRGASEPKPSCDDENRDRDTA